MKRYFLLPMVMTLISTGCGPIGPSPGLAIGGEEQPAPDDFAIVQEHDLIQIRTVFGGWLPQVHNIWGVGVGSNIYAVAVPDASWRARLIDDPNVVLRVGDAQYKLTASPVTGGEEKQLAFDAYMAKYGPQLEEMLGRPGTIEDIDDLVRFTP